MDLDYDPVVEHMQSLIREWEEASDQRAIFLSCYLMMTSNMLSAIEQKEFNDPAWVDRLLHRFAEYYFVALEAYEQEPTAAPPVWQLAHKATQEPGALALQKLLLGVNAHINYDLVLTLVDLLGPEWVALTEEQRYARYADHCHVNDVIGATIDAVQDQVLEPSTPLMDVIDRALGPLDEMLISRLIRDWREKVWQNATRLLETSEPDEQALLIRQVEEEALRLGRIIVL
jgi:hypothetical protein